MPKVVVLAFERPRYYYRVGTSCLNREYNDKLYVLLPLIQLAYISQ